MPRRKQAAGGKFASPQGDLLAQQRALSRRYDALVESIRGFQEILRQIRDAMRHTRGADREELLRMKNVTLQEIQTSQRAMDLVAERIAEVNRELGDTDY